jgi:hypothetical protein
LPSFGKEDLLLLTQKASGVGKAASMGANRHDAEPELRPIEALRLLGEASAFRARWVTSYWDGSGDRPVPVQALELAALGGMISPEVGSFTERKRGILLAAEENHRSTEHFVSPRPIARASFLTHLAGVGVLHELHLRSPRVQLGSAREPYLSELSVVQS